ncbi:MAG: hypothetical protein N4A35_03775 [Flavobacteriales bacterium]|jgi:hypothetical protein|nr:hypothetical protein [Flavobacteriales bacterium]
MKKIVVVGLMCSMLVAAFGQDKKEKALTAETQFRLVNLGDDSYVPNLKLRCFISEKSALRTTINYHSLTSKVEINEVDGEGVGTVEKNNSLLTLSLGYEKHFRDGIISPYVGGELKVSTGNNNEFGSRTDSVDFIPNYNYSSKVPVTGFGVHLFTGVDIDLYKNLYVGTELGLAYQSLQQKRGEFNVKDASSLTDPDVTTSIAASTKTSFQLVNLGVIRLGWRF